MKTKDRGIDRSGGKRMGRGVRFNIFLFNKKIKQNIINGPCGSKMTEIPSEYYNQIIVNS